MELQRVLPVLEALQRQHLYIEMLRDNPKVPASHLQKCESILSNIESALDDIVTTPPPRLASEIKVCIASVLGSIGMMEKRIAEHEGDTALPDALRLQEKKNRSEALLEELTVRTVPLRGSREKKWSRHFARPPLK